jgi:hypothetical protein
VVAGRDQSEAVSIPRIADVTGQSGAARQGYGPLAADGEDHLVGEERASVVQTDDGSVGLRNRDRLGAQPAECD